MIAQDILHILKQINTDLAMSSAKLYQNSTVILIQIIEYNHDKNKRQSAKNKRQSARCHVIFGFVVLCTMCDVF
jgi:hypothetical protein